VAAVNASPSAPKPRGAILRIVLLDVAPPLVGYYGLRAAGASEYAALVAATVLSGVKVSYDAVKARRLDPFACYLLLTFGLSLAVALATSDPRLILAGNTMVNGIGGLLFLGSCVVGTPLTQVVAERFKPTDEEPDPDADAYRRRAHISLSAMWGIGLIVEVGVRLVVISRVSVDVANGLLSAISWGTVGLLIAATILVGRRLGARWEQRTARQG
jgi:uncharacterized membrane protein